MSPSSKSCGLYDELADALGAVLRLFDTEHTTIEQGAILGLVEAIVVALRHDNARFNEARFRTVVSRQRHARRAPPNARDTRDSAPDNECST